MVRRMALKADLAQRDYEQGMYEAKRDGMELGLAEGREIGRKEGLQEGKREGKQEGKKEGKKEGKIEVAKKMLERGIKIEIVMEITGLSKDEIEENKF